MVDETELRFLRGAEADRSGETPAAGEPLWTTDEKRLFIGDGSTAGGVFVGPFPPVPPGAVGAFLYPACIPTTAATTGTLSANTLYFLPFAVADACTVDRLAIEVTGATGAGKAHVGIFTNDSLAVPGDLLVDSGEISLATTGVKTSTVSTALAPGWYWSAFVTNAGGVTFRTVPASGSLGVLSNPDTSLAAMNVITASYTFGALPSDRSGLGALRGTNVASAFVAYSR